MAELPFQIPPSLSSYLEQFEEHPVKTTGRLQKQLKKRGADAVGYFVLAWLHHCQEQDAEAVEAALKAKMFAPGSPFFEKLHYFFSHPELFDAWCSYKKGESSGSYGFTKSGPILDLDHLIKKLSQVESSRIQYDPDAADDVDSSMSKESDDVDDIVSETLAKIHEQQGKYDAAIRTYQKLKRNNKEKKSHYETEIERLKKEKKNAK